MLFTCKYIYIFFYLFFQTRTGTGQEYDRNRIALETRRSYRRTKVRHNHLRLNP